jgi:hypothetical protein
LRAQFSEISSCFQKLKMTHPTSLRSTPFPIPD